MQYTFTPDELLELLAQTIKTFAGQSDVFDFSHNGIATEVAIEKIITNLIVEQSKTALNNRLENSLPYIPTLDEIKAEGDDWLEAFEADIPFDGQSVAYETTDNISEAELGLMPPF